MKMASDGVCAIKEEYIITKHRILELKQTQNETNVSQNQVATAAQLDEPPEKKIKIDVEISKSSVDEKSSKCEPKRKSRGQNKGRPKPMREALELRACPTIVNVREGETQKPCLHPGCKYIHDPLEFLKNKPQDISVGSGVCYVFESKGVCPRGLSCRFGSKHITPTGGNVVNLERELLCKSKTSNIAPFDVLLSLQKRKYDLSLSENLVNSKKKERTHSNDKKNQQPSSSENNDKSIATAAAENITLNDKITESNGENILSIQPTAGTVTDEDIIKLRAGEKKSIDWKDKLYLGPLTTLGNLPFRRICKEFGADITCGEMALCDSLLKGTKQEWALVKRHSSENLFGVQICGSNPYAITKTSQILQKEITVDFVDLNLGCPIDLVYRKGGGSGMLLRLNTLETSIKCASEVLNIPFTIKTRTGVYQDTKVAHTLVPKFIEWGVSMMTIHGRSREQRYTKFSDWDYIEECAKAANNVPVFGNGDIMTYDDYIRSRQAAPHVAGVMIGRGALIKPWVFTEIKEQKLWDIRSSERFEILKKYTNYGLEHWGSDTQGVETTRRFLLEWLSFLHRYVPVGILEKPPQRINERPPLYIGRDDLETLMASSNCADWVKLSEMLVGPVPDGFQFLPKHKANSY